MTKHWIACAILLTGFCGASSALQMPLPQAPDHPPIHISGGTYLGVSTREVTADRVNPLKLKEESGVEVTAVDRDAPAGKAGIREHDVIVSYNNSKVDSQEQLRRMVSETPAGRSVNIGLLRDGQPLTVRATLASRNEVAQNSFYIEKIPFPNMDMVNDFDFEVPTVVVGDTSSRVGMQLEGLTPQLAEFFGSQKGGGLLVRSVEKGGVAEKAGLKAGDVIVSVDKEPVSRIEDWRRVIRTAKGSVQVAILRNHKAQTVTLTVPERKRRQGQLIQSYKIGELMSDHDLAQLRSEIEKAKAEASRVDSEEIRKAVDEARKEVEKHREDVNKVLQQQNEY